MQLYCAVIFAVLLNVCAAVVIGAAPERVPENLINVSWGDQILIATGDAQLDTPAKIVHSEKAWQRNDHGDTVLWRIGDVQMDRYFEKRENVSVLARSYYTKVRSVRARFDPIQIARKTARENGQQFLLYTTILDHGAPASVKYGDAPFIWQDRFTIEHPEYQTIDRQGRYHYGVLELAYPQARKVLIDRAVNFVNEFDADGVYICTRTHSRPALHADQFGFSPPVVEAMKEKYGVNILTDKRFDYTRKHFDSHDPMVEEWRRLRGSYLIQFYRELRQALPGKNIYTGIPIGRYLGPPYGNLYLDWETIVRDKLVDGLVIGVYSGKSLYGDQYTPGDQIGYLSSDEEGIHVPSTADAISKVYGPVCRKADVKLFFNSFTYDAQQRRLFQSQPLLDGFMINTPAGGFGRCVIDHDAALCFPDGRMTVEAFIKPRQYPDEQGTMRLLSKYNHDRDAHRGWEWILNPDGTIEFRVNQGAGGEVGLKSKTPLRLEQWTHLASVLDAPGGQARIYVNGKLDAVTSISTSAPRMNLDQDLYIGRYGGMNMAVFNGLIDELRLSDAVIDFRSPPTHPYSGEEPHTVALYHFDALINTRQFKDDTPAGKHPAHLLNGASEEVQRDSLPGFGSALNISPAAD